MTDALVLAGDGYDVCYQPPTAAGWTAQVGQGLVFGLDVVKVEPAAGSIEVTDVDMIQPVGGIALVAVSLVPSASVSSGTLASKGIQAADPTAAKRALLLPSRVPGALTAGASKPVEWQLAAVVRAPQEAEKASMHGLTISYRTDGGPTQRLTTRDTVTLGTGKNICPA